MHFQYIALKILFNFFQTGRIKFLTRFLKMVHTETEVSVYLDPGENCKKDISRFFALIWCIVRFQSYSTQHIIQCRKFHEQHQGV